MLSSPLNFRISYARKLLRLALFSLAILAVAFAFFHEDAGSIRTLWVLDTSLSMVVQDIGGEDRLVLSRLDTAKQIILSGTMEGHGEDALLTFDDVARLQLPFSTDIDTLQAVVRGIEPVMYGGATDIGVALSSIALIYPHEAFHIVLLTDGENSGTGGAYPEFPTSMDFSIVGIGTTEGGPMLQGYNAEGKPRYKQYAGSDAISRLDRAHLSAIAEKYKGKYYEIANIRDIQKILPEIVSARVNSSSNSSVWILSVGILLFLVALLLKPYKIKSETRHSEFISESSASIKIPKQVRDDRNL